MTSNEPTAKAKGVGARLRRKEDRRFLRGVGRYIGDFRLDRMRDVAFVRSPVAHASYDASVRRSGSTLCIAQQRSGSVR